MNEYHSNMSSSTKSVPGQDAGESGTNLCPWPQDNAASWQEAPFSIVIEF